jgi:hypothetical protein
LQGVSLGQGFAVVVGRSDKDVFAEFLCIRHSTETRNDRQLEQDVRHDPEGKRGYLGEPKLDCK